MFRGNVFTSVMDDAFDTKEPFMALPPPISFESGFVGLWGWCISRSLRRKRLHRWRHSLCCGLRFWRLSIRDSRSSCRRLRNRLFFVDAVLRLHLMQIYVDAVAAQLQQDRLRCHLSGDEVLRVAGGGDAVRQHIGVLESRVGNFPVEFFLWGKMCCQKTIFGDGVFYEFPVLDAVFVFSRLGNDECRIVFLFWRFFSFCGLRLLKIRSKNRKQKRNR